jgi:hypothetical protein
MNLSSEYSRVALPLEDQYYLGGEAVTIVRRGGNSVRVKRSDGETIKVPWTSLTREPGGDSNPTDPLELVARKIEQMASSEGKKFVKLLLVPGYYTTAVDRNYFQYGKFPEITTEHQLKILANRLQLTGIFSKVMAGIERGTYYPEQDRLLPPSP